MISFGARYKPISMKRSEKRILTTHVGSLVRPAELKALAQSGQDRPEDVTTTDGYLETLQRATAEVVRKQAAIGLDIISDGEFGKSSWSNYVLSRVTGFEIRPNQLRPVEWLGRDLATVRRRDCPGNAERAHRSSDRSLHRTDRV